MNGAYSLASTSPITAVVVPVSGTSDQLATYVPLPGQEVYITDTKETRTGDGVTAVADLLPFFSQQAWINADGSASFCNSGTKIDLRSDGTLTWGGDASFLDPDGSLRISIGNTILGASGGVTFNSLPQENPGVGGQLWYDGTDVPKITPI